MKISGIIAEYNPFHSGHKYMIDKVRQNTDAIIAVMSGSFVQRGDTAVFDKWTRAKAALLNGVDLVVELPAVFASATAERFCSGAVDLISSLGCVDELCFGSECGDIKTLSAAADALLAEDAETSSKLKEYLALGCGFPAAREKAYEGIIPAGLLSQSNNILAIEYIKALKKLNSSVKPTTLQRNGDSYNSANITSKLASATALRTLIFSKSDYSDYIPDNLYDLYKGAALYSVSNLDNAILYTLRSADEKYLSEIADVSEGLENRLKQAAKSACGFSDIVEIVSSKRYPRTKIMRITVSVLLGIKKELLYQKNSYIRVLGFNDTGRTLLKKIKSSSELPIIIKTADWNGDSILFEKDILATDIAALCAFDNAKKTGGRDYTIPPVYIRSE